MRARIAKRSKYRCCYCHGREALMGVRLQIDHIIPRIAGGVSRDENLCLACSSCNRAKSAQTHARDPLSRLIVPLFNPNTQKWFDHFRWTQDGTRVVGLTPCGRATVLALHLNNPYAIRAREFWVKLNEHPPAA